GKIHYMAPEQATGRAVDRRADVWGIGAMLYRMLAGHGPYEGTNQLATLHLLTSNQAPPDLPSHVPAQVQAIVQRALMHDLEKRYPSTDELRAAIEEAIEALEVETSSEDIAGYVGEH